MFIKDEEILLLFLSSATEDKKIWTKLVTHWYRGRGMLQTIREEDRRQKVRKEASYTVE